jgi:beta-lactamase class A
MIKTLIAAVVPPERLADRVTVDDPAPSDGILRFRLPAEHRLADLVLFMVAVSDNTATNAVIRHLGGVDAVNERIAARGWASRLHREVGAPGHPDLSAVSITDHQDALRSADPAPFLAQQDRRSLARWVVDGAPFAHKTGTAAGVRHDAGVLGRLSVACFTDNADQSEYVDHPACVAMGHAMRATLIEAGYAELTLRRGETAA